MLARETVGNCIGESASGPVPQHYVHKINASEVYLTNWRGDGRDRFRIAAEWPDRHHFDPAGNTLDPLLLSETIRQTFPLLCHAAYGVPMGHRLIWERFSYRVLTTADALAARGRDIELHVQCHDIAYRGTRPTSLSMWTTVTRGGVPVAQAETRFAITAKGVYQRLRGKYADASLAMSRAVPLPESALTRPVGSHRTRGRDDVLTPPTTDGAQWLRVDTSHPGHFDHPVDHVPGMLLLEAAHQAALGTSADSRNAEGTDAPGTCITSLTCQFKQYVELDLPCALFSEELSPNELGHRRLAVEAVQNDRVAFTAELTTAPTARTAAPLDRVPCRAAAQRGGALS
ncbi:ScbA/BarX family gamma-butyrolactone biosynthesis protein [Streptomyces violascens]|uniref:ScbA/BarX family gamma-butyrolactone biosynthesis protein n=1 Tax=Streptomyces violascens TaxID=67381 RepID=UPI003662F06F